MVDGVMGEAERQAEEDAHLAESLKAAQKQEKMFGKPDEDVAETEKVFKIRDWLYLVTNYGEVSRETLDSCRIDSVVCVSRSPPEECNTFALEGITYANYDWDEEPGKKSPDLCLQRCLQVLQGFDALGRRTAIHCEAGLNASAAVAVGWLMKQEGLSLKASFNEITTLRGRRLEFAPSFWMALSSYERELQKWPKGTPPSFDFRLYWIGGWAKKGYAEAKSEHALVQVGDWVDFEAAFNALKCS
eukprot:TRINITY_DN43259_c0_g1_i1.p1 TRINITY_DN43259_c0_g1~~TRINITY_DN43259_c0_g1_i1.p1  ORF type:complete len:257 (-),score=51.32 TRINITY_DN43259_c0_g1_i1:116-850(-)